MRLRIALVSLVLAFALLADAPSSVVACTGEQPTLAEAVRDASAIVRVVALDPPGDTQAVSLVRTLKGTQPRELTLDRPRTNLCGDFLSLDAGAEAIVAYDVPFYGTMLTVAWLATGDPGFPIQGSAHPPAGASTLDDVEAAIVAALPNTATPPRRVDVLGTIGFVLIAVALALGARRARPGTTVPVDHADSLGRT